MKTEPSVQTLRVTEDDRVNEDDDGVTLTAVQDKTIQGKCPKHLYPVKNIFLDISQPIMVSTDLTSSTNGQDMVTVLQQQFVQMPRSEAFRLGYIHPQLMMPTIGGVQTVAPTIYAVQPASNQLVIANNQITSQAQVVVQQRNCLTLKFWTLI